MFQCSLIEPYWLNHDGSTLPAMVHVSVLSDRAVLVEPESTVTATAIERVSVLSDRAVLVER